MTADAAKIIRLKQERKTLSDTRKAADQVHKDTIRTYEDRIKEIDAQLQALGASNPPQPSAAGQ